MFELPSDVRVQGIENGHVDAAGTGILAYWQRTEPLTQTVGKSSHEVWLRTDDFQGGHLRATELAVENLEKLGALGGECGRKIRSSRNGSGQQPLDIQGRHSAPKQEFRELSRHRPSVAPSTPELEDDLGLPNESELVAGGALDVCGIVLDPMHLGAEAFDLARKTRCVFIGSAALLPERVEAGKAATGKRHGRHRDGRRGDDGQRQNASNHERQG